MKNKQASNGFMESSQLMELFQNQLKDIYWAEKALTKALPKLIKNTASKELAEELSMLLDETHEQIERLTEVFTSIDLKPVAKKCDAMEGLIKEAEEIMDSCEDGPMCDAGIILAGQKIEHYKIASYGTLCAFAKTLELDKALTLLQQTLDEVKEANTALSEFAKSINVEALDV